jgi:uncharacterized membrane protein YkvI
MANPHRSGRRRAEGSSAGSDAAMVLGLLITGGFALAVATLLLLELLVALPAALSFLVIVSIVAAILMLGRAVSEKITSLPSRGRSTSVPVLRRLRS